MKKFYGVSCLTILVASLLNGQQTQNYSYASQNAGAVTTSQVDPNALSDENIPGYVPGAVVQPGTITISPPTVISPSGTIVNQPGYQYQNAPTPQVPYSVETTVNPFGQDYSYGQSSVQYAQPILPIKPYVPYSQLSPAQNAYPLAPYTSPEANQVNQQFMQRQSQQGQDFIRSQFGYPQTFIDPNAGLPPLGRPIRFSAPLNLSKGKNRKDRSKLTPQPLYKTPETPTYFFPGMVALSRRLWVGSDYLFFLPSNIGVVIEVVADKQIKSDEGKVLLEESKLKKLAEDVFRKVGINPQSYSVENAPPLPFFHLLILMYHVDNKIFASVSGRLFEEAMPARIDLDAPVGTFQAITWEKNEILIASALQAPEQLELMVNDIATTFVNRYRYFAELELDETSPDDLR